MTQTPIETTELTEMLHENTASLQRLRHMIQVALKLEFSTIPVYCSAMYSLVDRSLDAYQLTKSVAVEEMLHVNLAANLLIGVGGNPKLTGRWVPKYPSYLPHSDPNATPYLAPMRASRSLFQNVLMAVERPAPYFAPPEGKRYTSIAQFYAAIEQVLENAVQEHGESKVFRQNTEWRQRTDIYIGKGGGRAIEVVDLKTAKLAIREIVQQGEGAVDAKQTLVPEQPWASYNSYGTRDDGTYGPILGAPHELSHYYKFKKVADAPGEFPDTYPVVAGAHGERFGNPLAQRYARLFNMGYSVTMQALENSFRQSSPTAIDPFFSVGLRMMHEYLPRYAALLMGTPIWEDGDASVGPNAAPTWEYIEGVKMSDLVQATLNEAAGIEPSSSEVAMGVDAQAKPVATPTAYARFVLKDLASDLQNLCHELSIPLPCD